MFRDATSVCLRITRSYFHINRLESKPTRKHHHSTDKAPHRNLHVRDHAATSTIQDGQVRSLSCSQSLKWIDTWTRIDLKNSSQSSGFHADHVVLSEDSMSSRARCVDQGVVLAVCTSYTGSLGHGGRGISHVRAGVDGALVIANQHVEVRRHVVQTGSLRSGVQLDMELHGSPRECQLQSRRTRFPCIRIRSIQDRKLKSSDTSSTENLA